MSDDLPTAVSLSHSPCIVYDISNNLFYIFVYISLCDSDFLSLEVVPHSLLWPRLPLVKKKKVFIFL